MEVLPIDAAGGRVYGEVLREVLNSVPEVRTLDDFIGLWDKIAPGQTDLLYPKQFQSTGVLEIGDESIEVCVSHTDLGPFSVYQEDGGEGDWAPIDCITPPNLLAMMERGAGYLEAAEFRLIHDHVFVRLGPFNAGRALFSRQGELKWYGKRGSLFFLGKEPWLVWLDDAGRLAFWDVSRGRELQGEKITIERDGLLRENEQLLEFFSLFEVSQILQRGRTLRVLFAGARKSKIWVEIDCSPQGIFEVRRQAAFRAEDKAIQASSAAGFVVSHERGAIREATNLELGVLRWDGSIDWRSLGRGRRSGTFFSPNGSKLLITYLDDSGNAVGFLIDTADGSQLELPSDVAKACQESNAVDIHNGGVLRWTSGGSLHSWSAGAKQASLLFCTPAPITSISVSPNGKRIGVARSLASKDPVRQRFWVEGGAGGYEGNDPQTIALSMDLPSVDSFPASRVSRGRLKLAAKSDKVVVPVRSELSMAVHHMEDVSTGSFEEAFPQLADITQGISKLPLEDVAAYVERQSKLPRNSVEALGVRVPARHLLLGGGVLILTGQFYFLAHLTFLLGQLVRAKGRLSFPWIALYPGWRVAVLACISAALLPLGTELYLAWRWYGLPRSVVASKVAFFLICVLSLIAALLTAYRLLVLRADQFSASRMESR